MNVGDPRGESVAGAASADSSFVHGKDFPGGREATIEKCKRVEEKNRIPVDWPLPI